MSTKGTLDKDYDEEEIEKKFVSIMEKQGDNWTCKACEEISLRKDNLNKHAKKHIKGIDPVQFVAKHTNQQTLYSIINP